MLLDEGLKTFAAWGVMAHPTEVVLDAGGRIAYVLPGYPETLREELEEAIRKASGHRGAPDRRRRAALSGPQEEARALASLGRQFLAKGDPERAREAFRRAAAADPDSLEAAIMVARISLALGSPAEAEQLARQVSPEAINRGDLRYLLGSLMLFKGDLDAAERTFRALQERLPAEGWGRLGARAWWRSRAATTGGALAPMEQAARLQPGNLEAEAFVRRHFRDRCLRQEPVPEEAGFVKIFPALAELRERYCRVFAPRLPAAERRPRDQAAPRRRRRLSRFGAALSRQRGGPVRRAVRALPVGDARGEHGRLPAHRLSDRARRGPRRLQPRAASLPDHRFSRRASRPSPPSATRRTSSCRVGETVLAVANACGQVVLGLAAVWAGHLLANLLPR